MVSVQGHIKRPQFDRSHFYQYLNLTILMDIKEFNKMDSKTKITLLILTSLDMIITPLERGYEKYKRTKEKKKEREDRIEASRLKEETVRLEAEKLRLEAAQKVIIANEHLVSNQLIKIIKRIFNIYPTNKVDKIEFSTEEHPPGSPQAKICLYKSNERSIIINLNILVPRCPGPKYQDDSELLYYIVEKLSVRGKIYTTLVEKLFHLLYDIENSNSPIDRKEEEARLLKKYKSNWPNIKVPGYREAKDHEKRLSPSDTWTCSFCREYIEYVASRENRYLESLDDYQFAFKDKDSVAFINENGELYCTKCYEIQKKNMIEEKIREELNKRSFEEIKDGIHIEFEVINTNLSILFGDIGAIEPPLIIKEPYFGPMVFKELMKGIDIQPGWASSSLNWPDTCVICENNTSYSNNAFYSMKDYYRYRKLHHSPKPEEVKKSRKYWENIHYDDEYHQLVDKYKAEIDRLRSCRPPRKGQKYINHCWYCKETIDSDYCKKDPGFGYICEKCGNSLRGYLKY